MTSAPSPQPSDDDDVDANGLRHPRVIGDRYRVERQLKSGEDTETLLASDLSAGTSVVVKTAQASSFSASAQMRLEHEAQILSRRSLRILLAEDGVTNQKVACGLLERRGHQVVVANNGREAVEAVERDAFDLVLMDVMMPEMDGLKATAAIREKEHTTGQHIQIVAMTAHALKGDRERCLSAGMDAYLSKPVQAKDLYQMIDGIAAPTQVDG